MRISVLVLEGVFDSGLSVVLDTLATANDIAAENRRPLLRRKTGRGIRELRAAMA